MAYSYATCAPAHSSSNVSVVWIYVHELLLTGEQSHNGNEHPSTLLPPPILAMQDNLLENFLDICSILPPHPPRNHGTIRFEPYHNDRPHKHLDAFPCQWDNEGALCGDELRATPKGILAHLRQDHGIGTVNSETYRCLWIAAYGQCAEQLKFRSFGRHIIKHTGIRIKCSLCDTTMPARNDLATRHRHHHPNCSQADFIIIPGHNTEVSC
ncbi:hypothetical protein BDR03DRAFT_939825 [Suillus americanus]|nr:hypothetical protein BDR03DRAFT_976547 [Suillus americanus]KAG2043752.1 hypothetical protein BDR03DRAFT_939825 [Suillus americanus]